MKPASRCSRRRHVGGFTLIDVLVIIVLVGTVAGSMTVLFSRLAAQSAESMRGRQMLGLAQTLLAEVNMMPMTFCDPQDARASTATAAVLEPQRLRQHRRRPRPRARREPLQRRQPLRQRQRLQRPRVARPGLRRRHLRHRRQCAEPRRLAAGRLLGGGQHDAAGDAGHRRARRQRPRAGAAHRRHRALPRPGQPERRGGAIAPRAERAMRSVRPVRGFTLIEMIISIVLISLLALVAAPMLRLPLSAWLDATRRAELTQALDTVHSKLADDLKRALPNSVRVRTVGARVFLETLELRAWGRHRAGASGAGQVCPAVCSAAGLEDLLEAGCNETCFTSLGPLEGDAPVGGADWVVVNPLGPGVPAGDPYFGGNVAVAGGIKSRLTDVVAAPDGNRLRIGAHNFPALASNRHFYVVATPVTWDCNPATGQLVRRWGYPVSAVQPVAFGVATPSAPLATSVGACSIRYQAAGGLGRGGIVQMTVRLRMLAADTQIAETVDLVASLPVSAAP